MADKEASEPVFDSAEIKAIAIQAWHETRRLANKYRAKAHFRARIVPFRKFAADESRQYKINF